MPVQPVDYTYKVLVDDNFHHMDEGERYELGVFDSCEAAIAACKNVVDGFLLSSDLSSKTPEQLWELYTTFGDDAFIITSDPHCSFSTWNYAKQRCTEILQNQP